MPINTDPSNQLSLTSNNKASNSLSLFPVVNDKIGGSVSIVQGKSIKSFLVIP